MADFGAPGVTDRASPLLPDEPERAVLGGILLWPEGLARVRPLLSSPDCFGGSMARTVYRAVLQLADAGTPIDSVTLHSQLGQSDEMAVFAADLIDAATTPGNLEHHARIVLEGYRRRAATTAAEELSRLAADPAIGVSEALSRVSSRLVPLAAADPLAERKSLASVLWEAMRRTEERVKAGASLLGPSTGFDLLDDLTDGPSPGELWVLAARPSEGKTALGLHLTRQAAEHDGPVLFFSLEMGPEELIERLLSSEAGASLRWARKYPEYFNRYASRIAMAAGVLSKLPIALDATARSAATIRLTVQNEILSGRRPSLVLIDYLGLMQADAEAENRNNELGRISADLKRMARDFQLPVIALHQLNRSSVKENREPQLHDLRDSGEIEQNADVVPMLHWPEGPATERGKATAVDLYVRKERNGERGKVPLLFETWTQRFREAERMDTRRRDELVWDAAS